MIRVINQILQHTSKTELNEAVSISHYTAANGRTIKEE
jgi:hypothetical protein